MTAVLLILAGVMGLARRDQQAVISEARRIETEAADKAQGRFIPRDLIRLCQFIEVWIPPK